ncbi:MAG: hypothetical protein NT116_03600 [Candidatus Parcubacteria bacterium]|nr:hypothetical protein [Candidatus Parcubacteria bacterium]
MFLTVHSAIGIIIGQNVHNPFLAFILGLASHYVFDLIPHGDTNAPEKWKNNIHIAFAALLDMTILIIFLLFLGTKIQIINLNTALAFFGAIIPDFLQGFYFLSSKKMFRFAQKIHDFFHFLIADTWEWKFTTGIILQILFFIFLITIIL